DSDRNINAKQRIAKRRKNTVMTV
ncbi:Os03g0323100, partial [Oryza sativa Japonica Group]